MNATKNNSKQILKLPTNYSVELAEETGIHIGDGSMNMYRSGKTTHWEYSYAYHAIDDKEYSEYVKKLMKALYNLYPVNNKQRKDNTRALRYSRKELVLFKKRIGLPFSPKENIDIPHWIIKNSKFTNACVRGIFATDGSFMLQKKHKKINYYPQLKISSKSKKLIYRIGGILTSINIKNSICCDKARGNRKPNDIWNVYIYGVKNMLLFVNTIGLSNAKHIKKYKKWKINAGAVI